MFYHLYCKILQALGFFCISGMFACYTLGLLQIHTLVGQLIASYSSIRLQTKIHIQTCMEVENILNCLTCSESYGASKVPKDYIFLCCAHRIWIHISQIITCAHKIKKS